MKSYETCRHAMTLTSMPSQPGCVLKGGRVVALMCANCDKYEPNASGIDWDEFTRTHTEPIQTDCTKCIYHNKPTETSVGSCELHLRTTRPICPCFDDGKEVKS